MHRVIISGITGHLGQELARQLLNTSVEIHGLTRQAVSTNGLLPDGVRLHQIDSRTETYISIFKDVRPDAVIHLAALARREHRSGDVVPFVNANILLGTQLLEAARQTECRRFVTAGSYLQYAQTGSYRAFNLYAATKQAFENVLAYYVDAFEFAAIVLTLCNVYGEDDTRPTLIADMAAACARGTPLELHAEEVWIDPVHVEDAATAFVQTLPLIQSGAVQRGELAHYSVTSGGDVSSFDLAALLENVADRHLTINKGLARRAPRRLKPWRGVTIPGWQPRISLEDGITRILKKQRALASM